MTEPTSAPDASDLESLLGAYALDALDAADRARVDVYLAQDAAARAEVDEMRETAATLALLPDSPMDAPPELWARIAEVIAVDESVPDELATRRETKREKRSINRWLAPLSIAAAIAIVLLVAQVGNLRNQLDDSRQVGPTAMAVAFDRAAKEPGAKTVGLRSGSGATLARVVLLPDGAGFLRGEDLTPLPKDQTYQLWAVTGSEKSPTIVSAGVLGRDPEALGFHASGPVRAFAITVEDAPGVVASEQDPVARGAVA